MNNMICWDCVLKHLSGALSYGKEILSGHTKGADLDHRPDLLGELVNAEHHLELMNREILNTVSAFRKEMQAKKGMIAISDLEMLRRMYLKVEQMSGSVTETQLRETENSFKRDFSTMNREHLPSGRFEKPMNVSYPEYSENLDIVFDRVDNLEMFRFSYESIKKHSVNSGKVYVLKSDINLSEFDVEIIDMPLYEFCKNEKLSNDFLLMGQNMAFLREIDVRKSFPAFSYKTTPEMQKTMQYLKNVGYDGHICLWDNCKPQPVSKMKYLELMKDIETVYPLTIYYSLKGEEKVFNVQNSTASIERPVCCSTKSLLRSVSFVNWKDTKCFQYLCEYLNKQ